MTKGTNASYVLEDGRMALVSNSQIAPKIEQDVPLPQCGQNEQPQAEHAETKKADELESEQRDESQEQSHDVEDDVGIAAHRPRRHITAPDRLTYR